MTNIHGFELVKETQVAELNARARLFRHVKTGAELLSLENDDENKVFGITFRTPPDDSTGVAHIMEHSVLSGSRKYPVKEPFVELMKGSLNTFLNALTFPDKTVYPVASQNLQDLHNLIDVYLDAVFYPRLTRHTFQEEAWHYELTSLDEPLRYKGVVFNEMKGAYSSPDSLLGRFSQRSLFPDNTYGFDSGGDPQEIPDLTYQQFKTFHDTYYHPSNARIFFYGDGDPDEHLRLIDDYLQDFDAATPDSAVDLQPLFEAPHEKVHFYDASADDGGARKSMLTVNWVLTQEIDPQVSLGLSILSYILVSSPASPLRKALIDSGLGEDLAGGGADSNLRQMTFSTGLKGIDATDAGRVEALILDTLATLAQEGIEPDMIEAAINTIEFRLRENNTGPYPRGLVLMLRSLSTWLYDEDPVMALAYEEPLTAVKSRLESGEPYFENLIRQYLLENPHRTTVLLKPDPTVGERREATEKQRLADARAKMDEAELQAVIENTRELQRLQETPDSPEALATIPSLTLEDLDKEVKTVPLEVLEEETQILYHDLFTNGIVYLDLGFDLSSLPADLLPYLPLFGQALVKIGTEEEDFVKLSQRIGRETGGIWPSTYTSALKDTSETAAWLFLRGKATVEQAGDLLDILRDILLSLKLDNQERFKQMVLERKAGKEAGLVPGGHQVVNMRLRSHFNTADWIAEQMGGISSLFFVRRLMEEIEEDWPAVLARLEQIREALLHRNNMLVNVTLDQENWQVFRPRLARFISVLPAAPINPMTWHPRPTPDFEGLTIPAQVNYVGKAANLYELGYEMDGSIAVISNYLRTTWLWERVRVRGGAYGGFSAFNKHSGVFSFLSYRDPNLLDTLQVYDETSRFLRDLDLSQEELTKSIIGTIGKMDAYQLPDAKGYSSMIRYITGDTDEKRQQRREEILSTSPADFKAFAEVLERLNQEGHVVVMGSEEAIEAANAKREDWLHVQKVL
jgi:hypothetical protein